MEFKSFEQALVICLNAEEGSLEQDYALAYCLENAPPDLKETLIERQKKAYKHECGCGCKN